MSTKPKAAEPVEKHKHGDEWLNPISGLLYKWDAVAEHWKSTGTYPFGTNPMGFLGDGA